MIKRYNPSMYSADYEGMAEDDEGGYVSYEDYVAERADLAALVVRMARALYKPTGNTLLAKDALDYLKRKGLTGSPLREGVK